MSRFLRYIGIMFIASISLSSCTEHIKMETMTVIEEKEYKIIDRPKTSLYTIHYSSSSYNNDCKIYVVANSDLFEVGDKVKLIKSAE